MLAALLTGSVCVVVQPVHSTAFLLLSDQGLMESPGSEEQPHTELMPPFPDDEDDVSLSHSPLILLLLVQPLPLLRVISQAVLKWPPASFPSPSYMLFGAVSSKPHLHSPKQRGCHCAVTGSIDF